MKRLKKVALLLMLILPFGIKAQQKSVKLYLNYSRYASSQTSSNVTSNSLGHLTPAITFNTLKGNFHELEVTNITLNRYDFSKYVNDSLGSILLIDGEKRNTQRFGVKYEFNYLLNKKNEGKLKLFLGVGINFSFQHISSSPKISTKFKTVRVETSQILNITPRINYNFSEHLFLDFNIPVNITKFQLNYMKNENPQIPVEYQTATTTDVSVFPNYLTFKLGVGYKF